MHIFRVFGVGVLIPLIIVGLVAGSGGEQKNDFRSRRNVQIKAKHLSQVEPGGGGLPRINFHPVQPEKNETGPHTISPRSSSPHPHPVYSKSKSATQSERRLETAQGRGLTLLGLYGLWSSPLVSLIWRAIRSYAVVALVNVMFAPILRRFGWGGPYWETSINLGNEGGSSLLNFGPSLKKFRLSFGGFKGSKNEDKEVEDGNAGGGWGEPSAQPYGHGQPGHVGFNPHHVGPGWLSYDQAALALPMVDKYAMKAAKKAQRYTKKAQKYAHKASKYAAKAQAAKLSMKPLYANGFIHPGAATVPGIPSYGWGK